MTAPASTSFNDLQKMKALDFKVPTLMGTERLKNGKGKAAGKGGGGKVRGTVPKVQVN